MPDTPAGWFPDPMRRFQSRYWDGTQWTAHVATDGVQATDPLNPTPGTITATGPRDPATAAHDQSTAVADTGPGFLERRREERRTKAATRDEFERVAVYAAAGDAAAIDALPATLAKARTSYRAAELERKLWGTMAVAIRSVIDDDVLTVQEQNHIYRLAEVLGTPIREIESRDPVLYEELVIAAINDGRLPRVSAPGVLLKAGEEAYGAFGANLVRERDVRQFRGGSSGVSVPVGFGIRYRVGSFRGQSVVIGTELVTQDTGVLFVTSQRALFTGRVKTLEFRHDRLVGLEQYTDGLRLNVSNRQTASLLQLNQPSIAAALIQVAAGKQG